MLSGVLPKWISSKISTINLIISGKARKPSENCKRLARKNQKSSRNGCLDRTHYEATIPNQMHQLDLLYMPRDMLYVNKYKYVLSGIDVASRYKVARPMRTKQAKDVAEMIADIYKVGPLTHSKIF